MGYTTNFEGKLTFSRVLSVTELRELEDLADYQKQDEAYDKYADTHPDSYNQWEPSSDGLALGWNGAEKFYEYVEWLEWLIHNYFEPRGIILNGVLRYQGEEISDVGRIEVSNNSVKKVELDTEDIVECPNCGDRFKPNTPTT
jgi:hypothetical protein